MRKITLRKWPVTNQDGTKTEETTIDMISVLIDVAVKENSLNGLEQFQIFSRLTQAFEEAKTSGFIKLGETDYKFLKDTLIKHVPAVWALNPALKEGVEEILNAKEE